MAVILVKILLDATFSGIPLTESFCVNEYIAKIHTKIFCNIFFWSLRCSFASNKAGFENSIFNLPHKVPPSTSFEIRKSLKRMPSLANTDMDQTKYRVSSMFASGCIIWTKFTRINMYTTWLANFRQ